MCSVIREYYTNTHTHTVLCMNAVPHTHTVNKLKKKKLVPRAGEMAQIFKARLTMRGGGQH